MCYVLCECVSVSLLCRCLWLVWFCCFLILFVGACGLCCFVLCFLVVCMLHQDVFFSIQSINGLQSGVSTHHVGCITSW